MTTKQTAKKREITTTTRIKRAIKKFLRKRGVDEKTNTYAAECIVMYANARRGVLNGKGVDTDVNGFVSEKRLNDLALEAFRIIVELCNTVDEEVKTNIIEALLITNEVVNA